LWGSLLLVYLTVSMTFVLIELAPGDMVDVMAGEAGTADPGYIEQLRSAYGLDQPLLLRYEHYLQHVAKLDLGFSFRTNQPVVDLILQRLGPSALLMAAATGLALLGAIPLALLSARFAGGLVDRAVSMTTLIGYATPSFLIGLTLILVFSVELRWLPSGGKETLFSGFTGWSRLVDSVRHLILPAVTLGVFQFAVYTRVLRASLINVLHQDFVRTARAKGLSELRTFGVHALGNALLPLVTMVGVQTGALLGGSVVVESIFAWPGLGRLAYEAIAQRDTNLLNAIVMVSTFVVATVNFLVDILYFWLDPRIEHG
jgi:peptide/nickel transport system permease protein